MIVGARETYAINFWLFLQYTKQKETAFITRLLKLLQTPAGSLDIILFESLSLFILNPAVATNHCGLKEAKVPKGN